MCELHMHVFANLVTYMLELKQISESVGYPFEIYYPDSDPEPFRIVANYFKQFEIDFELSIFFIATESV